MSAEVLAAVKAIPVREGQTVAEGDALVCLDDAVVQAEYAKAEARLELARQQLAELEAGPRKEEIAQAREAVNSAEPNLAYVEKEHTRLQQAVQRGVASAAELSRAFSELKKARSELARAKAQLALLEAGTRPEQIARARAEVTLAQAERKRWDALRGMYILRASHPGIVTVKYVNVGEIVSPGQVLLRVEDIEAIEIRAQVQESQLQGVRHGSEARVLPDAYPDRPLRAVVDRILPRVDPEQGTVTVLLRLTSKPPVVLMDGMAADIAIVNAAKEGVLRIPIAAIERDNDETFVWVKTADGFARRRVTAGAGDGYWAEVTGGLQPGDVIRLP